VLVAAGYHDDAFAHLASGRLTGFLFRRPKTTVSGSGAARAARSKPPPRLLLPLTLK
jgi:hypothetical protein